MKIALFVEGSPSPPAPRQKEALERIWNEHLVGLAGRSKFVAVYGLSKQNLENLDPKHPRASGNAEALDDLIARTLKLTPFDAAVVAWDLLPGLKPEPRLDPERCRWLETKWIMARLAASTVLPEAWRLVAETRRDDYAGRVAPTARATPRPLVQNEVRLLCMEPEFESLLLAEREMRELLGAKNVKHMRKHGWPQRWIPTAARRGKSILHAAIQAARSADSDTLPAIAGTFAQTAPNEWAEWMLRRLSADAGPRARLEDDPTIRRLRELLPEGVPALGATRR